jgi:hypothetical protein
MFENRIQVTEGQVLTLLAMAGNVTLATWDQPDVLLRLRDGEETDLQVELTEAGPAVSARVSCDVQVPASLPVKIREAKANLQVTGVSDLDAEQVRGNLKLSDVAGASIAEVYGNLKADQTLSLRVAGTVFGSAALKGLDVADLQNVRGNLRIRGTDHLRASRIGGNLQATEMGALNVDQVGGNAMLKGISRAVTLGQVAGNLAAKNLSGGAKVPKIGGNLALNGEIGAGCTYHFQVRGNATLRLPPEASAHVALSAKGKIRSSVTMADQVQDGNTLSGTLGDGGAEIAVEARGNVMLGGGSPEASAGTGSELGEEISRQIEASLQAIDLEAIGHQVSEEMDAALSRLQVKLESVDWERIGVQSQRTVERAMEQMRRNMDRMVEKAARHQEKMERKVAREQHRLERLERRRQGAVGREHEVQVDVGDPAAGAVYRDDGAAEPGPDLDEERLSILRMVEQGQIAPEEAEMLLDALQQ